MFNANNFNPHKKPISLLNVPSCTQGMQQTWWPEAGTIIVNGPYYFQWFYICQGIQTMIFAMQWIRKRRDYVYAIRLYELPSIYSGSFSKQRDYVLIPFKCNKHRIAQRWWNNDMCFRLLNLNWPGLYPWCDQAIYIFILFRIAIQWNLNAVATRSRALCKKPISMVSCQKGPTSHAYAWQIGPFWQDTLVSMADRALLAGYPR